MGNNLLKNKQPFKILLIGLIILNVSSEFIFLYVGDSIIGEIFSYFPTLSIVFFAWIHGLSRYGWKRMFIFFILSTFISFSYETLSIETGFPFGNYFYSDLLAPKIGDVPILIMLAYFSSCYLSWIIAHILLSKMDMKYTHYSCITISIIASFIMVMWDLSMDPSMSTINGEWIWKDGGSYFGVPIKNFFGWFLTVYTIFLSFSLYLKTQHKHHSSDTISNFTKSHWILPIVMWLSISVEFYLLAIFTPQTEIKDPSGMTWSTTAIYSSLSLVSTFTMGFVSVLGFLKIFSIDTDLNNVK